MNHLNLAKDKATKTKEEIIHNEGENLRKKNNF